ncbi:MAG: type III-A CRISPR-associated protein Csm2 [Candidatus Methanomethylicaceae archaeon]
MGYDWRHQRGAPAYGSHHQHEGRSNPYYDVIVKINALGSLSQLDPKDFADENGYAARIADRLKKEEMKTHQLRRFFDPLVKIREELKKGRSWKDVRGQVHLTLPLLAFSVGRKLAPKEFYDLARTCINKIESDSDDEKKKESFLRFMDFLEAIVAYQKYFEETRRGGGERW